MRWLHALLLAGLALVAGGPLAHGALVWEESGPAAAETLTAVAVDPGDPRVVWVGGGSSVWVSDDAGDSWRLVLLIAEGTRAREAGDLDLELGDEDEPTDLEEEDELEDAEDEAFGDDDDFAATPEELLENGAGEAGVDGEEGLGAEDAEAATLAPVRAELPEALEARLGSAIVRLRVVGGSLYVATGRGLWQVDRAARTLGSGRELRFGRRIAALDVAARDGGGLWVATTRGLLAADESGTTFPVQGQLGNDPVRALLTLDDGVRAAGAGDIWVHRDGGFVPLGLTLASGEVLDMVPMPGADFAATTGREVFVVARSDAGASFVASAWPVPPVARVAVGREADLWTVGSSGAWRRTHEGAGWEPRMEGLAQGRLIDATGAREGVAWMWVVGTRGAYRLIPEAERVFSRRAREQARQALTGLPTITDVFEVAARHRHVDFEETGRWRVQKALSFLLPEVSLRAMDVRERNEELPFVQVIRDRILQEVRVLPVRDEVRVEALWDLYPAVVSLLGLEPEGGRELASEIDRRRLGRQRLRQAVTPLYNEWLRLRVLAAVSQSESERQTLRDHLALEQLEADLRALTGGWFAPPPLAPTQPLSPEPLGAP